MLFILKLVLSVNIVFAFFNATTYQNFEIKNALSGYSGKLQNNIDLPKDDTTKGENGYASPYDPLFYTKVVTNANAGRHYNVSIQPTAKGENNKDYYYGYQESYNCY